MKTFKKYNRELTVTLFITAILGFLISDLLIFTTQNFFLVSSFGFLLLLFWFLAIYLLYANKKVKRHAEVLIRVRFLDKFFKFFLLPSFYYALVVFTLFFVKSIYLNIFILISFSIILFTLMVHIRSSYEKIHYTSSLTKIIYDAVIIMSFFLGMFVVTSLGFLGSELIYFAVSLTSILLFYKLLIDNKICINGFFLVLQSVIFLGVVTYAVLHLNLFTITAVTTISFYLVISMWTIRLEGYTKWSDYLNPILYTLMALILIFSL